MNIVKISILLIFMVLVGCKETTRFDLLDAPTPQLLAKIEPYVQPSTDFVYENEKHALDNGVALTNHQKAIARELGVKDVDKVRVVFVDELPYPTDKRLITLARKYELDSPRVIGFTYGYGIFIKHGHESILPHELVHVKQFERMGVEGFMRRYLLELSIMGYSAAPLEVEAYQWAAAY